MNRTWRRIRPYAFEGVRVAGIMAVGDVLAQTVVEGVDIRQNNWERTARFSSLGLIFIGPALKLWYRFLNKKVTHKQHYVKRGLKKMVIDQTCFAPGLVASIMAAYGLVNGESLDTIQERLKKDYLEVMKYNYIIWPAAQTINFSLVPLNYQVVFAQIVAIVWNIVLSKLLNKEEVPKKVK